MSYAHVARADGEALVFIVPDDGAVVLAHDGAIALVDGDAPVLTRRAPFLADILDGALRLVVAFADKFAGVARFCRLLPGDRGRDTAGAIG